MKLTGRRDAFGQLMMACYRDQHVREIVERDDGYVDVSGGPGVYFREYRDWPGHEKTAMGLVRGRVLDIGCGAGRHCLYLQQKGFEVVGIDNSALAVRVCRLRGVRDCRLLSFADVLREPVKRLGGRFDTVLLMCGNFGLFESPGRLRSRLRRLRRITSPGALVLGSTLDPYDTKVAEHLEYHRFNRTRGRLGGQARIRVLHKKYRTPWFWYLLLSRAELRRLLPGTGWRLGRTIRGPANQYIAVLTRD